MTNASTSNPTAHEVESFIGTLETSYTYDPPERWRDAYDQLRGLRPRFDAAHAPYAWLSLAGLVIMFATMIAASLAPLSSWSEVGASVVWFFIIAIPLAGEKIASFLARRHEPLLRYENAIDDACGKFDRLLAERNNAPT